VTAANIHYSQVHQMLLDPENQDDYFWAGSAYSGKYFEDLLSLGCPESRIDKSDHAITLLASQAKSGNVLNLQPELAQKSSGCMTRSMDDQLTQKLKIEKNEDWWNLKIFHFISSTISRIQPMPWPLP